MPDKSSSIPLKYLPSAIILAVLLLWIPSFLQVIFHGIRYSPAIVAWVIFSIYYWRAPKTGLAAHELRRNISIAAILGGLLVTVVGAFLLTFKIAWLGVLLSVSGLAILRLGVVPWTRVMANLSLIWIAWPLPGGVYEQIDGLVHRLGIRTATAAFDLLGIPVFSVGDLLEFRQQSLASSIWTNGPDSIVSLLLFAVLTLVWKRRTLVPSLGTLAFIPLIGWVGETAKILIWYWWLNSFAMDLSIGWPMVGMRTAIFVAQLLLILMVNWGVHWSLMPVLADPNARTNISVHSLFNMLTLWPLQLSMTAQQADQEYFEGDFDDDDRPKVRKRLVTRQMPSLDLTKKATDPWINPKLNRTMLGLGIAAILLSIVANFVPPVNPMPLPHYSEQTVARLASSSLLEGLEIPAQFTDGQLSKTESQYVVTTNLAGSSGPIVFVARLPSRSSRGVWTSPQGMELIGPSQVKVVEQVTMHEATFVGQMGASSMGWFAAMLPSGGSLVEPRLLSKLKGRLSNSLLGRLIGLNNEQVMFETALIVDSQNSFSERQKREYRMLFAKLSHRVAESLQGEKP